MVNEKKKKKPQMKLLFIFTIFETFLNNLVIENTATPLKWL